MQMITTIGLDIAKSVFQVHGVDAGGQVVIHRTRHLFIRQQTAVINSIRAHLAEFGILILRTPAC
jgi:transposase